MTFAHRLTVRFSDCDMYGHVNNATYLTFLECARVQLLREVELPLEELIASGLFLVIVGIEIQYKEAAKMGDLLEVATTPLEMTRIGGVFLQEVKRDEVLIAAAKVKWVCVDESGKPARLPEKLQLMKKT
jgi:YbgC/YbaW family acyl-CoA thioester hydrolase